MAWARYLSWIVIVAMIALGINIIANSSLDQGLGMDRFIDGLSDPWRAFIGFDLMTGLLLFAGWIVWRQRGERVLDTIAWVLCINWWGNIVVAAYILVALRQSGGDPARFFMGARAGELHSVWAPPSTLARALAIAAAIATTAFAVCKINQLGLSGLPGQTYLPGFLPVILALVLLAFPASTQRAR